jgi:hypothetical protein
VDAFQILAEARIREWQERKARGEELPSAPLEPGDSIESQLFDHAVALRRQAHDEESAVERERLLREAEDTRLRLVVILEQACLPLLAQSLDARLWAMSRDIDDGK